MSEQSYLDILTKLKANVKSDNIPAEEKEIILKTIYSLEVMLWKYSA